MPRQASPIDPLTAESLEAAIEVADLLVVVLDRDARILYFNGACERLTGHRADEVKGRPVWDLIPPEQREEVAAVHGAVFDAGEPSRHENDWLTRDGGRRRVAWSNAALRDEAGAVVRGIGTGLDVTDLRRSRREQSEAEQHLAAVIESAMDAIVTLDDTQRIVVFNAAAERMFGHQRRTMLGQMHHVLVPEHFRATHSEQLQRFAESGVTTRRMGELGQVSGLHSDGSEFPAEASISRTRVGGHTLLTAVFRDISDRMQAAETAALLESVVESSGDAIVATDRDGRILSWNPAAEEIYGHPRERALELRLCDLAPSESAEEMRSLLVDALEGRSTSHHQADGLRSHGERFAVALGLSPRRDGSGAVVGASLIARDISSRKELELQLRRSEEMASLGTLIAGLAHDIGTPMNVILGYIGMLASSLHEDKDRERLQIVREQVERVVNLVKTLMGFARSPTERAAPFDVNELLDRALDLIPELARRRGIEIERDFAAVGRIRAQGDRLQRAFLNVFVNACDAMAESGGTLRVTTELRGEGIRVRIADTGAGVPAETLPRIFDPFFTTKERGQGSGLGLFVTRGIVLEQGGEIDVESEAGRGTEFRIELPREAPEPIGPAAHSD